MIMRARILTGDMRETLKLLPDNSVDAIVTDPPYGLSFMNKGWDHQVPGVDYWRECLRVAKPGAHIVAFSGTRTGHRLACAIEDAGWELRDCLMWLYGSGFPKSHDVSKAIDKEAGAERQVVGPDPQAARRNKNTERFGNGYGDCGPVDSCPLTAPATPAAQQWQGWGTALKPAWEPIYLARKPFDGTVASNVLEHGTGAINVDGCRIEAPAGDRTDYGLPQDIPDTGDGRCYGARAVTTAYTRPVEGRWPANLCLDESAAVMLDEQTGVRRSAHSNAAAAARDSAQRAANEAKHAAGVTYTPPVGNSPVYGDSGGASRFFYVAKASRSEREAGLEGLDGARANTHPTVKPIALMQWLIKLITPPGGIVLDPFNGSGSTGCAAVSLGHRYIGCELNPEYVDISMARMRAWAK